MRSRTALPSSSLLSFTRTCALTLRGLSLASKAQVDCMDADVRHTEAARHREIFGYCISVPLRLGVSRSPTQLQSRWSFHSLRGLFILQADLVDELGVDRQPLLQRDAPTAWCTPLDHPP